MRVVISVASIYCKLTRLESSASRSSSVVACVPDFTATDVAVVHTEDWWAGRRDNDRMIRLDEC